MWLQMVKCGDAMSREDPQLKVRVTEEMKAWLTETARANGRSVNAEIVARLEAAQLGGTGEAGEWQRRFEEEHHAFLRMDDMFTKQMEMVDHFRRLLSRANREVFQQASAIETLATIILELDDAPSSDIRESVERILASAKQVKAEFGKTFHTDDSN